MNVPSKGERNVFPLMTTELKKCFKTLQMY